MAARTARWDAANPSRKQQRSRRRPERVASAPGYHNESDIQIIRNLLNDECFYCGKALHGGGHLDHMTPLMRGGSNWPENLVVACVKCNLDKHAKTAGEFIQWRKRYDLPLSVWHAPIEIARGVILKSKLSSTGLSFRCWRSLEKVSVLTVGDLIRESPLSLYRVPNFGLKCLREVQAFLSMNKLRLGMRLTEEYT